MVLIGLVALLFVVAYVSKRRFGLLALGLTAGSVLAQQLSNDVSLFVTALGVNLSPLTDLAAASLILMIVPVLLLAITGPKVGGVRARLIGAIGLALFGGVLVLPILAALQSNDQSLSPLVASVLPNTAWLTSIGVLLALLDAARKHKAPVDPHAKGGKH